MAERKEAVETVGVLTDMTPRQIAEALLELEPDELSNVLHFVDSLTVSKPVVLRPLSRPRGPLVISAASAGHGPGCGCVTHYRRNDGQQA